jgi:hypothetical protein
LEIAASVERENLDGKLVFEDEVTDYLVFQPKRCREGNAAGKVVGQQPECCAGVSKYAGLRPAYWERNP